MARRRRRGLAGLGDVNPDAGAAIRSARKGNCKSALKYLHDASPHVQSNNPTEKHRSDYKIASIIVAQHCTLDTSRTGRRKSAGFDGARRRKRRR